MYRTITAYLGLVFVALLLLLFLSFSLSDIRKFISLPHLRKLFAMSRVKKLCSDISDYYTDRKVMIRVLFMISAAILLSLVPEHRTKAVDDENAKRLYQTTGPSFKGLLGDTSPFGVQFINYHRYLDRLSTTLSSMVILIIVGISVYLAPGGPITVPILAIQINPRAFRLLLPAAMILIWLQFGYLLHSTINQRIGLFRSLDTAGESRSPEKEAIDGALHSTLNDGGLLDLWFRSFRTNEVHGLPVFPPSNLVSKAIGTIIYATILGALHGVMLALLFQATVTGVKTVTSQGARFLLRCYFSLAFLVMACSHFQFAFGGCNENYFQYWVIGLGSGLFVILYELRQHLHGDANT